MKTFDCEIRIFECDGSICLCLRAWHTRYNARFFATHYKCNFQEPISDLSTQSTRQFVRITLANSELCANRRVPTTIRAKFSEQVRFQGLEIRGILHCVSREYLVAGSAAGLNYVISHV